MPDHVHIMILRSMQCHSSGLHQGEECDPVAREFCGISRNYVGQDFWTRGYFASTVGRDEQVIRHQEAEDRRIDQMSLV